MTKNKSKKVNKPVINPKQVDRPVKEVREIDSGELGEGNALEIGIMIPGKGRLNIKISFEKE